MMFASKTLPKYLPGHYDGDGCVFGDWLPHFSTRQHNAPNPILVALREEIRKHPRERYSWGAGCMVRMTEREAFESVTGFVRDQIGVMSTYDPAFPRIAFGIDATSEHFTHARRVLTRLTRLTEGAS